MIERYLTKFDEVNRLVVGDYESGDRKKTHEDFLDFLVEAYFLGMAYAEEQIGRKAKKPDPDDIYGIIFWLCKGETFEDRIDKHLDAQDPKGLEMLAESEFHRVFNAAADETANALTNGRGTKTWVTMRDWKVRDTHYPLEGVTVPMDGVFVTYDGDTAKFPGDFERAENNCGCRCWLEYSDGNMETS